MIQISIKLYHNGCLKYFNASGHACAGKKGEDIVCAAVTVLLRTSARILSEKTDLKVHGTAPKPGIMSMYLDRPPVRREEWVRGISDFLISGFEDLKEEYPDKLDIDLVLEADNGT